jgi:indolepyruvate ferredoxin oxidoreductase
MGLAWQRGLLPVSRAALLRTIELNGTAVELNKRAFLWGRILAEHPELWADILNDRVEKPPVSLDALIDSRAAELARYQDEALAARYRKLVRRTAEREIQINGAPGRLTRAVAENYFRLLAYKDEYEVARLHSQANYGAKPVFYMAPPLITGTDPATGRRRKIAISGTIASPLFRLLRHGKRLRGTAFDPFGWQHDRRAERKLIAEYEQDLTEGLGIVRQDTLDMLAALAELPQSIRGYGKVKAESIDQAAAQRAKLKAALTAPPATPALAAE